MLSGRNKGRERPQAPAGRLKERIIVLIDEINRDRDAGKLRKEQFPRLEVLVDRLTKGDEG